MKKAMPTLIAWIFFLFVYHNISQGAEMSSLKILDKLKIFGESKDWRTISVEGFDSGGYSVIVSSFREGGNTIVYQTPFDKESLRLKSSLASQTITYSIGENSVSLSPTGEKFGFWLREKDEDTWQSKYSLYVMPINGQPVKIIDAYDAIGVCWSPDEKKIAFVGQIEKPGEKQNLMNRNSLYVIDLAYQEVTTLVENDTFLIYSQCWSPDGSKLLYTKAGDWAVMMYDFQDKTLKKLTSGDFPAWSPLGDWIIYRAVVKKSKDLNYYLISPDGEQKEALFPDKLLRKKGAAASYVLWSPDGKYILYSRCTGWDCAYKQPYVMELSTRTEEKLPSGVCGLSSWAGKR